MSEVRQFRLPDVGEGLTEADIVKWHVQPGDTVTVNQIIVEIETAKAVVELPCPYAGVVSSLLVTEGTTADVGTPIIAVEVGSGADGEAPARRPEPAAVTTELTDPPGPPEVIPTTAADLVPPPPPEATTPQPERQAVLVGYGVKVGTKTRRARKPAADRVPAQAPASPARRAAPPSPTAARPAAPAPAQAGAAGTAGTGTAVLAKPPVRKLARDLGVDLTTLAGSGPNGSISRDDVHAAAATAAYRPDSAEPGPAMAAASALPREERIAVRGVRKHTAAAMTASAFTAPHVTMFLQIDITQTMTATARLKAMPDFEGSRVSPLLLVAKALLVAAGRHPMINSSWDEAAQEIVVRHYVNLGIAAATDRGLVVPNIKDAQALSLPALAKALTALADSARAGR
ncbi:MAG TPA: dihydrolipoamide acetyltransferase family protein, partial [Streptosporangiaceae bacterium]